MCLLDTIDGALTFALYSSSNFAQDQIGVLYYSIVLTIITIVVAIIIGIIQLLSLVLNVVEPTGRFWDGVGAIGNSYDIVGGAIVGLFVVGGVASVLLYKPWRRRVDRKKQLLRNVDRAYSDEIATEIDREEEDIVREAGTTTRTNSEVNTQ